MVEQSFAETALSSVPVGWLEQLEPPRLEARGSFLELCRGALARPIGGPSLRDLTDRARRIAVVISDESRDEPRRELLEALFEVLPRAHATLVVASGTHQGSDAVVPEAFRDLPCVVHDARALAHTVELGVTSEGTRVRLARVLADADLVVVTGRVRPHYFAGYSGGTKGVFPGCGYQQDILDNHQLKSDPSARLGSVEGNRCRQDMEEAALMLPGRLFLLNVLADAHGTPVAAASGHPVQAHRHLVERAREVFRVTGRPSRIVVVADRPPVSSSLYQASKLLPPAGALLEAGGAVVLVADCRQGVEPLDRVNEGIYRLGVASQLPEGHEVFLVSSLGEETVARTYARHAPELAQLLQQLAGRLRVDWPVPVLWRAGEAVATLARGRS